VVVGASVNAVELNGGVFKASIGLRINTANYGTQSMIYKDQIAASLQEHLASATYVAAIMSELHKYPEFAAVSSVEVNSVSYDHSFEMPSRVAPEYSTLAEDSSRESTLHLSMPYAAVALIGVLIMAAALRRFT
jgi:hypothetical protein